MKAKMLLPFALMALFLACQNPFKASSKPGLTISLNFGTAGSRTILPAGYPLPNTFDVVLQPTSGSPITQTGLTGSSWTFTNVASALYTITVTGKLNGNVVAKGSGSADMTSQAAVSVAIALSYLSSGSGTGQIHLTLDFSSAGATPSSVTLTMIDPQGASSTPALSGGGTS